MPGEGTTARRQVLRYSLRALLVVMLIASALLARYANWIRRGERQRYVLSEIVRLGGDRNDVYFSDERRDSGYRRSWNPINGMQSWTLRDSYWRSIEHVTLRADHVPAELLEEIAQLPDLRELTLSPPTAALPATSRLKNSRPNVSVTVTWEPRHVPFLEITSLEQLRTEASGPATILFVDGSWSFECAFFRPRIVAFQESWKAERDASAIKWLRIDLSRHQDPWPTEVRNWMSTAGIGVGGMKQYGAGRIIWFKKGQICDLTWVGDSVTEDELRVRTRKVLGR